MALKRNLLLCRRFHSLLNPRTTTPPSLPFKFTHRPIATASSVAQNNKPPLSTLFLQAVGLSEKTATGNNGEREEEQGGDPELKKNLRQLEEEVRSFKEKSTKSVPEVKPVKRSLYAAFNNIPSTPPRKEEEASVPTVVKKLSPDMLVFVKYLFDNGYFKDANFVKALKGKKRFDPAWFENIFAWNYIKFAAQRFAGDNQGIAKWLSGSALKQVAMFGCPSTDRKNVFPAKRLRKFFEVPENTVCSQCMLRESCKFVNQNVWRCDTNKLDLVIVMKVITSYGLESVHPTLLVSDEVKQSVNQLLKEFVKLSQTT